MSGVSGSPEGSSDLIGLTSAAVHCKKEKVSSTQIFKATDCTEFLS